MGSWSLRNTERQDSSAPAERFVWPPSSPGRDAGSDPPQRSPQPPSASRPPSPAIPAVQRPKSPAAPTPPPTLAQAWSQIEHAWLDVTAAPLAERMAAAKWRPDTPADYCPRCGISVGRDELIDDACEPCRTGETPRPPWDRIVRIGEFTPPLSDWIREVKFTRWRKLGRDLGRVLGDALVPEIEAARTAGAIPNAPPLIVPVPMPLVRRFIRGIDHTVAIARGVRDRVGGEVGQPLWRDLRPSQTRVAPSRRADNVARAFHARAGWLQPQMEGRLIIVVDDVSTTTSTLRGACRAVAASLRDRRDAASRAGRGFEGSVIWAAVLARTPLDGFDGDPDGLE